MDYKEKYKKNIREVLKNYRPCYGEWLRDRYKKYKYVCIWGCGNMGRKMPELLADFNIKVNWYCDNDPKRVGTYPHGYGIVCISPNELKKYKDETAVIVPTRYYKEIYDQLKAEEYPLVDRLFHAKFIIDDYLNTHNMDEIVDSLCKTIDMLKDETSCKVITKLVEEWTLSEYEYGRINDIFTLPQYFPKDIVDPIDTKVFVDCGAYNGDNVDDFLAFNKGKFEKYFAFELNKYNCEELRENIENKWDKYKNKFIVENKGVSDKTQSIYYSNQSEGSKIIDGGDTKGEVVSIDEYFVKQKVTFIKMDIEGNEIPALIGGKNVISRDYPTLAICIYHKPDDFWTIPSLINEHWPDYELYVRHHTDLTTETVLYAVKKSE